MIIKGKLPESEGFYWYRFTGHGGWSEWRLCEVMKWQGKGDLVASIIGSDMWVDNNDAEDYEFSPASVSRPPETAP